MFITGLLTCFFILILGLSIIMADANMPKKAGLEASEVDQALNGSVVIPHCSQANDPKGDVVGTFYVLPDGSTLDLTAHVAELVAKELAKHSVPTLVGVGGQKPASISGSKGRGSVKRPHDMSEESDSEAYSDGDLEFEDVLGAGINTEPILPGLGDDGYDGTIVHESLSGCTLPSNTQAEPLNVHPTSDDQDDIDPDLPSLKDETQKFLPSKRVTKWVRNAMDKKLTNDELKTFEKSYSHDPSLDDIISPIKSIKALTDPIKCKATQESDGKDFDRYSCEKRLYKGQSLIGLSLAPFMKALTKLQDVPGSSEARTIFGDGLRVLFEGWHEITYARRELYRCVVKRDIQTHLFANTPTHNQMFGGESIEGQVAKAITASKDKTSFIFTPSFRSNSSTYRSQASSSGFRGNRNSSRGGSASKRGKFAVKGRGKGKGKGKGNNTNAANSTQSNK